ncbi:FAD-binding oxidoreductase (plasmid) [Kovacikia minuta CCNUW1]|uniref:FAD-binding oxidoreductase n=1 Tax=Kovacikia minuta TaxID=2931930 RepID=UPI001CCA4BC8|nr:FAD-binding oxidoreductase [Kovacikia minuta]UBF30230.1 FAD-binding oxidoreductase [Kovacikia minuta CCNUW1]
MNEPSSGLEQTLSGWGRYPLLSGHLYRPEKVSTFTETLASKHHASVLARGFGRSYGDAAVNPSGLTVLTERLNRMLHFDERTGLLHCEAGVTIEEILEVFVPRGWFPAVTPGTKFVTVGGAVAFDVHGKNHHQDGAFGRYVQGIKVVLASGESVWCSQQENSDLFWATVGGMGLTGLITEVEFSLRPIQTAYIKNRSIKARNLDEAIALFEEYQTEYKYSVAWIDCLASGNALGRSILGFGDHADLSDLPVAQQSDPLNVSPKRRLKVSFDLPEGLLNPFTIRSFNALYFAKQLGQDIRSIVDYDSFFYPLDFLWDWNRLYGKRGFVQYQCAIPQETSREALTQILQLCSEKGWGSFLAVLKQLGAQEGWLSFPMPGYTLALDMPVRPGLWEFLEQLDQLVIQYGGRLYLAKDARLSAATFRAMYPKFPQWLEVKTKVDPENRFTSALSQRLQIEPVRVTAKA